MKKILTFIFIIMTMVPVSGQVAIKTNILFDAMTTPNLGVEVGLGGKSTLNLVYGLNPWKFDSTRRGERFARHWVVMPEYRWWTCSRFNGHFLGVHAFGGQLNANNVNLWLPGGFVHGLNLVKAAKTGRYQGEFLGAGVTYGYQWALARHWNIEAEIGAGYGHLWYDQYPCGDCGKRMSYGHANYIGLTKLGVSVMYVF